MRSPMWWVISLMFFLAMTMVGCNEPVAAPTSPSISEVTSDGYPKGMEKPRLLTEEEKAKVIEIALNTPEAQEAKEKYGVYKTGLGWVAIMKNESGGTSSWGFDYEMVDNIPDMIPKDARFYSRVEIYFGEPEQLLMRIAVNPDTGEVAIIDRHGLKILPK